MTPPPHLPRATNTMGRPMPAQGRPLTALAPTPCPRPTKMISRGVVKIVISPCETTHQSISQSLTQTYSFMTMCLNVDIEFLFFSLVIAPVFSSKKEDIFMKLPWKDRAQNWASSVVQRAVSAVSHVGVFCKKFNRHNECYSFKILQHPIFRDDSCIWH